MRRRLWQAAAVLLALTGCTGGPDMNQRFVQLADRYIDRMLALDPEAATAYGDHRFDHRLTDRTADGYRARRDLAAAYLDSVSALDPRRLDEVNRIDREILLNHLRYRVFAADTLREFTWNPLLYNPGGAIHGLIARDFAPLEQRLRAVRDRLDRIPDVVAAARANLRRPPRIYTETAIAQNRGNIGLILDELQPFLDRVPALRDSFVGPRARAIAALEDYGRWLEQELLPRSDGDFRLGEEKFRRKLRYTLESDLSLEEIADAARRELEATQERMYELALPLYREFFPERASRSPLPGRGEIVREVLDRIADQHPTAATIVDRARADLDECTRFVREHDLVTLPDEPIRVVVMPEFMRGVAIAYCDAPGPLADGEETFYSIAPPPAGWSPERVETYFREYNDAMLKELTIHEAMPGHYVQLAHANVFRAPTRVRALFGSGVFVEGWATYAEQLMAEHGFGGPRVQLQQLKMRLRLIINALLDQGIHCHGMTREQALDLMMNQGYQEEGEAVGKWRRACMSSTQLSTYFVGNLEVNRLRDDVRRAWGQAFDPKTFHDRLLSFGSPAPRYVRRLLGLSSS